MIHRREEFALQDRNYQRWTVRQAKRLAWCMLAAMAAASCVSAVSVGQNPQKSSNQRKLPDLTPREVTKQPTNNGLPKINERDTAGLGIRKLTGKHLTLYTDLPSAPAVDELAQVFDAAVPQWCAYFQVPQDRAAAWTCVGYVIKDKERFVRAGLLPVDLPPFLNGYQRGHELWVYEQPSSYYRRHLLLHEGTHAFMNAQLGGAGPPWYMEGMAELLATHRWTDGRLELNRFPASKEDVEDWGRIKIIVDAYRDGTGKRIEEILNYDSQAHLKVEPYGWCWALAAFLDGHPAYQKRFRDLRQIASDRSPAFSNQLQDSLRDDWAHVTREWQWYVANLDYGYDVGREAIARAPHVPFPATGAQIKVVADRGWQSTGIRLEAGQKYRIEASGRYQVGKEPKPWWCEPNGVTIRYVRGRPLGVLLGAVVDEAEPTPGNGGLLTPATIGMSLETTMRRSGTLYLRINDSPAELSDNSGELSVRITRLP